LDRILKFWNSQAESFGTSHNASWGDNFAIELEINTIDAFLNEGDTVLDVGCANGHATIRHIEKNIASIMGVDFSESMIREALVNKERHLGKEKMNFSVGDVRHLEFADNSFDAVYTTRTLINLPNWEEQMQGIAECIRVCKKGGRVIFSEAFWEPLALLNSMRLLFSLPPLVEHDFNRYLKISKLEEYLNDKKIQFERIDFSSVYYLGSRFLRELVTVPEDYPGYSNPINKIFFEIEREYSGGGLGVQQAYVVYKE
jgi:ubiquinone/menaquinone biosynthesis C-methylase UbiE